MDMVVGSASFLGGGRRLRLFQRLSVESPKGLAVACVYPSLYSLVKWPTPTADGSRCIDVVCDRCVPVRHWLHVPRLLHLIRGNAEGRNIQRNAHENRDVH